MGIQKIIHYTPSVKIGVWHICETTDILAQKLPKEILTESKYKEISNQNRQLEYLAVRNLCFSLLNTHKINYLPSGKPFLAEKKTSLSISHSGKFCAIGLADASQNIGIDVEQIKSSKILKVAPRFMSEKELTLFGKDAVWATLVWSAKESIFKCFGSVPDWRRDFEILEITQSMLEARYLNQKIQLFHYRFEDVVLTLCQAPKQADS